MKLSLAAYRAWSSPGRGGCYHAVVPGRGDIRGGCFADHASAIWRITGSCRICRSWCSAVYVLNPASYFVTGRASDWVQTVNGRPTA